MKRLLISLALAGCGVVSADIVVSGAPAEPEPVVVQGTNYSITEVDEYQAKLDAIAIQAELDAQAAAAAAEAEAQAAAEAARVEAASRPPKVTTKKTREHLEPVYGSGACGGDLPTCRVLECESHGNLVAENSRSSASGKWQFIDGTWNNFEGYSRALFAPEEVQDEKARLTWAGGAGKNHWKSCL